MEGVIHRTRVLGKCTPYLPKKEHTLNNNKLRTNSVVETVSSRGETGTLLVVCQNITVLATAANLSTCLVCVALLSED